MRDKASTEKRKKVMELVAKAMIKQDTATYHGKVEVGGVSLTQIGIDITEEIMQIFDDAGKTEHKCLAEDDVRRIMREELKSFSKGE